MRLRDCMAIDDPTRLKHILESARQAAEFVRGRSARFRTSGGSPTPMVRGLLWIGAASLLAVSCTHVLPDSGEPAPSCSPRGQEEQCNGLTFEEQRNQPDPCLSQCELRAGCCEEVPIEQIPDFGTMLAQWRISHDFGGITVVGECGDGTVFLYELWSEGAEVDYFDPVTGAFLARETLTDMRDAACSGRGYWPAPGVCTDPVVTEIIHGGLMLGDSLSGYTLFDAVPG